MSTNLERVFWAVLGGLIVLVTIMGLNVLDNHTQAEVLQNDAHDWACYGYVDFAYAEYTNHTDIVHQCMRLGITDFEKFTEWKTPKE